MYLRIFMLTLMFLLCLPVANAVECSVVFPGGQSFAGSGSIVTGANRPLCNGVDCVFENFTSVGAINLDTNRGGFPSSNDSWTFADAEYNYYTNAPANENYSLFTLGDTSAIYISGSVVFKKGIGLNAPSTGTGKPSELLIVVDGDLKIEENAVVNGFIYVNGNVILEKGIIFNGAVSATGSFDVKENGRYTFDPSMLDGFDPHGFCESATSQPITPILNYRFDECSYSGGTGEVIDQTASYPGTAFSSVDTTEFGQIERFVDISDANHHIETSVPLPASYSVSTWFKKPTSNAGSPYFVLGAMQNGGDLLYIDRSDSWRWGVYDGSNSTNGTYSFSTLDSNWHHLTLVYSGGQTKLYVDGTLEDTINRVPSGTLQYIGTSFDDVNGSNPQGFRAPLDEFMVYDQALTQPEISTIYNNQVTNKNYDGTTRDVVVCGLVEAVAGRITLNNTVNDPSFTHVCFDTPFSDVPVVFSLPTTTSNGDRLALRIRNVTTEGFDIAQVESPEKANPNAPAGNVAQTVDFLAVVEGDYDLDGGAKMRVRTLNTRRYQGRAFSGKSWETVSTADLGFTQTPAIIASIQTMNNEPNISNTTGPFPISEPFLATTIKDVTNTEFKIALERGETNTGVVINNETMGYIAITPGFQGQLTTDVSYESFRTDNNIRGINSCRIFNLSGIYIDNPLIIASQNTRAGSDGGWLKRCAISTSSAGFSIVEDRDRDNDTGHIDERAGGLALSGTFTDFANSCAGPAIDHFEINALNAQGLTCEADTIKLRACADASCSILNPDAVDVVLSVTDPSNNVVLTQNVTVVGGEVDVNYIHTVAEVVSLSLDQDYECINGYPTNCDVTFLDAGFVFSAIDDQVAGVDFSGINIQAVKDINGVCTDLLSGPKTVDMAMEYIAPDRTTANKYFLSGSELAKNLLNNVNVYTPIPLNFVASSIADLGTNKYNDAGQIKLYARYVEPASGGNPSFTIEGSSNAFWVSPHHFSVVAKNGSIILDNTTTVVPTAKKQVAGDDFTLSFTAENIDSNATTNYIAQQAQLQLERTGPTLGGVDGTLKYSNAESIVSKPTASLVYIDASEVVFDSNGKYDFNAATYSEVGLTKLYIRDNNYGSGVYKAEGSANVGRFIPAYFTQTVGSHGDLSAYHYSTCDHITYPDTDNWAYAGQTRDNSGSTVGAISYAESPIIYITAFNRSGNITQNYSEDGYMKLTASGITIPEPTADNSMLRLFPTATSETVYLSANMLAGVDPVASATNGVISYTFNQQDHFIYEHNKHSKLLPFSANIPFLVSSVTDSDEVKLYSGSNTNITATEKVITTGVKVHFGRWLLENSYGPETSVLPVTMFIQHFDGTSFITHDKESCLTPSVGVKKPTGSVGDGGLNLWDYRLVDDVIPDSLSPSDTDASFTVANKSFASGLYQWLLFSAPGPSKVGSLDVEYQVPPWLQYDWNSDENYNNNPSAKLTFGIFRGNDRIIYQREIAK